MRNRQGKPAPFEKWRESREGQFFLSQWLETGDELNWEELSVLSAQAALADDATFFEATAAELAVVEDDFRRVCQQSAAVLEIVIHLEEPIPETVLVPNLRYGKT